MITTVVAIFALFGAAVAAPVSRQADILGQLSSGAGFKSQGTTTAGATADSTEGVAGAGLDGFGTVFSGAAPGLGLAFAGQSPLM